MAGYDSTLVIQAVEAIYNPETSAENRRQAHQVLENVQESLTGCSKLAEIGFDLISQPSNSIEIRHCALQFIEHCVKTSWYDLKDDERQQIRSRCFEDLALGSTSEQILRSNALTDGLARIVVEIVKREWPQNWQSFLVDCEKLCNFQASQRQLALLILLRLVEDVVTFQSVQNASRRRELYNALVLVSSDLLKLAISVLRLHATSVASGVEGSRETDLRLCRDALQFISSLFTWVPAKEILAVKLDVLPLLCQLLVLPFDYVSLQSGAADCILQLVSRRHTNKEEMVPALELFNTDAITTFGSAARLAMENVIDENAYMLLKSISNIHSAMGQTLCTLWGHTSNIQLEPATFEMYLNALLSFFEHPSVVLRLHAASTLASFTKHDEIKKLPTFHRMLPKFVHLLSTNTRKIGLPSKNDSPNSQFSIMDFEDDSEFFGAWNKFREQSMAFLRQSVQIDYQIGYDVGRKWLVDLLSRIRLDGMVCSDNGGVSENELEALTRFLSVMFSTISTMDVFSTMKLSNEGREMLTEVLAKLQNVKAPLLLNHLLSVASALFPFLVMHIDLVPLIVRALFACASFHMDGDDVLVEQCRGLRHHAMHEFVRLSVDFPDQLLPHIDNLMPEIMQWNATLSPRQKCCLAEGLSALSNKFQNFDRQRAFTADVLNNCVQYWTSDSLSQSVSSVDNFMTFLGLSCPAPTIWVDESSVDFIRKRDILTSCVMLVSVLNRISVPIDNEARERGQFLIECDGRSMPRHPAFQIFQPVFFNVFSLARCLNGLYSSSSISKIHPSFGGVKAIDAPDVEKFAVHTTASTYGLIARNEADKMFQKVSIADHMKAYLADLTEQVQLLIGLFAIKFQWQFFALPQTPNFLLHGCLGFIDDLMDLRFRFWIRRSFLPMVDYVQDAGKEYFSSILPSLSTLLNATYTRLQSRWDLIMKRREAAMAADSADLTSQEVYLEELTTLLNRDAILLLHKTLFHAKTGTAQQMEDAADGGEDEEMGNGDVMMENGTSQKQAGSKRGQGNEENNLSELGGLICQPENGCVVPVTLTAFYTLAWPDTKAAVKAIQLCDSIGNQLTGNGVLDDQTTGHLFSRILSAIQLHGEHDNAASPLLTLACALYQRWFQLYPSVKEIMLTVPDCTIEGLQVFDSKLLSSNPAKPLSEKIKKDGFKKLIKTIIGTNVGQQFKRSVHLRDLPSMWRPAKQNTPVFVDLGLCNLFGPSNG